MCWGHEVAGQAGCVDFSGSNPAYMYLTERMGELKIIIAKTVMSYKLELAVDWQSNILLFSFPYVPNDLQFRDILSTNAPPSPLFAGSMT